MITQKYIKELFDYKEGRLIYRKSRANGKIKIGTKAGFINKLGYRNVKIEGKVYLEHRLIYLMHYGYMPEFMDHADCNRSNNILRNLRVCNRSQNACNAKRNTRNTSGVKGVTWESRDRRWRACVYIDGKRHHLGCFDDIDVAAQIVKIERLKLHGDFANHG